MKKTQFKTDIHQIFLLTKRNFSDWDKNPRIWMTFALGFVLCLMSVSYTHLTLPTIA